MNDELKAYKWLDTQELAPPSAEQRKMVQMENFFQKKLLQKSLDFLDMV